MIFANMTKTLDIDMWNSHTPWEVESYHWHGYGYVIKKYPVNTNGGEPLKTPEDFNVSA